MKMRKKPEIVAPAGDLNKLFYAVKYGADAVYLGLEKFGLRERAGNFSISELSEAISFAHKNNSKIYLTLNIFPHNIDIKGIENVIKEIKHLELDAVVVSDIGVLEMVKNEMPDVNIHISTQANVTNWRTAKFYKDNGATRIILARELTLEEIKEIKEKVDVELEVFVHGAMCLAYSGRCVLSDYLTGRGANKGDCAQVCRWEFKVVEAKRDDEFFDIIQEDDYTTILSSKDLRLIEHIPELVNAKIDAFKIEGRVKSEYYVAIVTRAYRKVLDAYLENLENYKLDSYWQEELDKVSHRPYFNGFLFGNLKQNDKLTQTSQTYENPSYERSYQFVGLVQDYDEKRELAKVLIKSQILKGDKIELVSYKYPDKEIIIDKIIDESGSEIDVANPTSFAFLNLGKEVDNYSILRKKGNDEAQIE